MTSCCLSKHYVNVILLYTRNLLCLLSHELLLLTIQIMLVCCLYIFVIWLFEQRNPDVAHQFAQGKFVVYKTQRSFSAIALDHAHEQNNKLIKGNGGAVGLTENGSQLLRWMVSGPEVARVVHEFQSSINLLKHEQSKGPDIRHHERQNFAQKRFERYH